MLKGKLVRMQELSVCLHGLAIAVFLIPHYRMSDILHMNTNLMRSSGFQTTFHQGIIFKSLNHLEMCTRIL